MFTRLSLWAESSDYNCFGTYLGDLVQHPATLNRTELPVVCNIQEAKIINVDYEAVIEVGPTVRECDRAHSNHRVWIFDDTDGHRGPVCNR